MSQRGGARKIGESKVLRSAHVDTLEILQQYTNENGRLNAENAKLLKELNAVVSASEPKLEGWGGEKNEDELVADITHLQLQLAHGDSQIKQLLKELEVEKNATALLEGEHKKKEHVWDERASTSLKIQSEQHKTIINLERDLAAFLVEKEMVLARLSEGDKTLQEQKLEVDDKERRQRDAFNEALAKMRQELGEVGARLEKAEKERDESRSTEDALKRVNAYKISSISCFLPLVLFAGAG